jgi:hypothetical protein
LGSEVQAALGSSCALAEGLVLLQATVLFFHPFPQVREHCQRETGHLPEKTAEDSDHAEVPGPRPCITRTGTQHLLSIPPHPVTSAQGPALQAGGQL